MPKEHCHWHLARRIADRLEPGPLADAVLAYGEFFLAGAVSHDSGYYAWGDVGAKKAADRLHGSGGFDTFAPLRSLAAHRDELGAPAFAFGLGALSHIAADATFHPLVFSWTGDADAPDPALRRGWQYRHLACETALDQHLDALWGSPPVRTLARLAWEGGRELGRVHGVFTGADSRPWLTAHRRLQRWLGNAVVAAVARFVVAGHRGGESDLSAAFYLGRAARHPAFEGTLVWIDPVTGSPRKATQEELVERFDSLALGWAAGWQSAWTAGAEPFAGRLGPALDTGLPVDRSQEKRFFSPQWF